MALKWGLRPLVSLMGNCQLWGFGPKNLTRYTTQRMHTHTHTHTYMMLYVVLFIKSDLPVDDFSKGVVFYLNQDTGCILGVLTWNLFGKMDIAKQVS